MNAKQPLLSAADFKAALNELTDWSEVEGDDAIRRIFTFRDFDQAFAFMTRVADEARRLNHHPTWINSYNRVDIVLSTHDSGGVTERDVQLARLINEAEKV